MSGQPEWWTPGMPDAEVRVWEAAQRAADAAPEVRPGDDVHLRLRPILGGWLNAPVEERGAA